MRKAISISRLLNLSMTSFNTANSHENVFEINLSPHCHAVASPCEETHVYFALHSCCLTRTTAVGLEQRFRTESHLKKNFLPWDVMIDAHPVVR